MEIASKLPLPDEEIIAFAQAITSRGLTAPAVFFLEMHKPLRGVAALALEAFSPLLAASFGQLRTEKLERLFADPSAVNRLLSCLEKA